jgi:imidazolonepropionase-like amidohydrolase
VRAANSSSVALLALGAIACAATGGRQARNGDTSSIRALEPGETGVIVTCAKVLTMNDDNDVFAPGMIVVRNGKIEAVGQVAPIPEGFEHIAMPEAWAAPGMVDLHSHIQTGGWGDINDMVISLNPEYRTSPTIVPANADIERACAGGVTTLFGIPGSGTNMSGFGVLYKTKCHRADAAPRYESVVLADPGGMKIAQAYNPERNADLGLTRCGMAWNIRRANNMAIAANKAGRTDVRIANLQKVQKKELPVLIHTAGSDACATTVRMWRQEYDTRSVLSHGCFDGWKIAPSVAKAGMPVNLGPRLFDWSSSREGELVGTPPPYIAAGVPLVSVNTDAPVMPEEEFFLQGAMGSRFGADGYLMLQATTINPAKQFGIDRRVGSLAAGKDADIVLRSGDPLDPRARVELVLIDGSIEYDLQRERQRF